MEEGEVVLRTEGLTRTVRQATIVSEVSIEVRLGDVLAVVGPSGSGKSSFLRLLNRLDEPTSGTVFLHERDSRLIPPRDLRRRVGMVLQAPFLFPGTIADNIRFGPRQWGTELSDETVESLLCRVGLDGYAARDVSNLSGGEAQRVSLARTLANEPEVVLLDEPTSALDDASKTGVEELLREILAGGKVTCIIVTHDMIQAARIANRVMVMNAGRVVRIGQVEEMLNAEPTLS